MNPATGLGSCSVCGRELTEDFLHPPTWSLDPSGRPVLNKPIRMDPETGAACWCPVDAEGTQS